MDERAFIGTTFTLASFGLAEFHLILACLSAIATIAYMVVSIRNKLK
jgi:hypothetical protein